MCFLHSQDLVPILVSQKTVQHQHQRLIAGLGEQSDLVPILVSQKTVQHQHQRLIAGLGEQSSRIQQSRRNHGMKVLSYSQAQDRQVQKYPSFYEHKRHGAMPKADPLRKKILVRLEIKQKISTSVAQLWQPPSGNVLFTFSTSGAYISIPEDSAASTSKTNRWSGRTEISRIQQSRRNHGMKVISSSQAQDRPVQKYPSFYEHTRHGAMPEADPPRRKVHLYFITMPNTRQPENKTQLQGALVFGLIFT
ncbi:uncharacterized protein [Ambystoma mexicanum]|uniref:uncharacterized protein n=1 Tax=Ambystoma mexicanum TaxID=8296 RepID=UPI0037E86199